MVNELRSSCRTSSLALRSAGLKFGSRRSMEALPSSASTAPHLWSRMYTSSLLPCAILGVMSQMVNYANPDKGIDGNATTLAFSVFLGLWSTVFLELWHRREFELRCLWGSEGFEQKEQPRLQFIGVSHCTITVGCVLRKPSESRYEF